MRVEFDWQLDVEEDWDKPSLPQPERPRRISWWLCVIVLVALIVGATIAVGRFWQGVRRGQEQLKHDLELVANLEARALRDGDRATYLWLQDKYDTTWYAHQKARMPYWGGEAIPEPGQSAHLAVLDAGLMPEDGGAWAEVIWAEEDGLYRRAQFYRQLDDRWVRTGAHGHYFGPDQVLQTAHFTFKYQARDQPTVDWMAAQLELWHTAICSDLGCKLGSPINVLVTTEGEASGAYRPPRGLTLRSPRLWGIREDGAPSPEARAQLAEMLVFLLAIRGGHDLEPRRQPYLLLEFVNWEMRRLGLANQDRPPTPVLDLVMENYGLEKIRAVLAVMGQTQSEEQALRLALGLGVADLDEAFDVYLAAKLGLERHLREWGDAEFVGPTSAPLARQLFGALLADEVGAWRSQMYSAFQGWTSGYPSIVSPSLLPLIVSPSLYPRVDHWERLDETTIWAEVLYPDTSSGPPPLRRIEFFRQVEGAWRHTQPSSLFLGDEVTLNSEHFRLVCHEREVEWMTSELAHLESSYQEIVEMAGVKLPAGERLTIHVTAAATWSSLRLYPSSAEWSIPSPYFIGWYDDQGDGYLVNWLAPSLVSRLAFYAAGVEDPSGSFPSTRQLWMYSVLSAWGRMILGPDAPQGVLWAPTVEPSALAAAKAKGLDAFSALARATFGSEPASYSWATDDWYSLYQQVFSVMDYIGDAYGQEALLSLLKTLPEADSLEGWLGSVLDVDLETLEADWVAWLDEAGGPSG